MIVFGVIILLCCCAKVMGNVALSDQCVEMSLLLQADCVQSGHLLVRWIYSSQEKKNKSYKINEGINVNPKHWRVTWYVAMSDQALPHTSKNKCSP